MSDTTSPISEENAERPHALDPEIFALLEGMSDGVTVQGPDGVLLFANESAASLAGCATPDEMIRTPIQELVGRYEMYDSEGEPVDVSELPSRRALEGGRGELVVRFRRRASTEGALEDRWSLVRAFPVLSDKGAVRFVVNIFRDITEQKLDELRLRFLARASEVLSESLDYETTLAAVVRLAVPGIADWCALDMKGEDGTIQRLAVAHIDPAKVEWAHELERRYPVDPNAPTGVPNVLRTGRSEFYPIITQEMLDAAARDDEHREIIRQIGFTSAMTVPLAARGEVLGAITLVTAESGRRFTQNDLVLAEDVARRAATAVDNARLYALGQRELAERRMAQEQLTMSERRFRTMIEQSPLSIQIFDTDGLCIAANQAWETLWQSDARGLVNYNILKDAQLEARGVLPLVRRAFAGEPVAIPPVRYDPEEIGASGRVRWVRAVLYPVRSENDDLREVVLLLEDVTQQKESEGERDRLIAEIQGQRARLNTIIANLPGVIWEARNIDEDATIEFISDYVEPMLGYDASRFIGVRNALVPLIHPEDQERVMEEIGEIARRKEPGVSLFRMIARDGRHLWVEARASAILDERGEPVGTRGLLMDITERKQAEEELARAKQAAEAASRAKDQFLAILSHELRTPLTPVLTLTQVLRDEPLPEEIGALVEIIHRNVELEARLIDDLLDLTRIERGKLQLNLEEVDLHALVRNVLDICRSDILGKGLSLEIVLEAGEHIVQGDPARLQQVVWNLVKNAVKFTPEGGSVTIHSSNRTKGRIDLSVTDTGIGIAPEVLPRIFDAFEQGEQRIMRQFGGLGLGLAISRALVEMHGGEITADSQGKGSGATFCFSLVTIENRPSQQPSQSANGRQTEAPSLSILIVDDHRDTSNVMRMMLERLGYRIAVADDMASALAVARSQQFDLIVSDIGLPDGSGLELMRRLRSDGLDVPAIALSGFGMEEDIQRSMEAGFQEHLTKPVGPQKLHETILRVARGK